MLARVAKFAQLALTHPIISLVHALVVPQGGLHQHRTERAYLHVRLVWWGNMLVLALVFALPVQQTQQTLTTIQAPHAPSAAMESTHKTVPHAQGVRNATPAPVEFVLNAQRESTPTATTLCAIAVHPGTRGLVVLVSNAGTVTCPQRISLNVSIVYLVNLAQTVAATSVLLVLSRIR